MTKPYYLDPDDENYISKTDIKREAKELQELARNLCSLSKKQRQKLSAHSDLLEAFTLADKISDKPDAFRRHMQYMAKVLRDLDNEALKEEYDRLVNPHLGPDLVSQRIEQLRDQILSEGDGIINDLLQQHPNLERQKIRQLVRQAKKEVAQEKPGKNYKELFQYLKANMEA
jgi:ribosome-associated protein